MWVEMKSCFGRSWARWEVSRRSAIEKNMEIGGWLCEKIKYNRLGRIILRISIIWIP